MFSLTSCPTPPPRPARAVPKPAGIAVRGLALVALALGALPGGAQGTRSADQAPAPAVRHGDWMVSLNPFGLIAGGLTGEMERRMGGAQTGAVAVSYWSGYGGWSYLSVDAKLRRYRRGPATTVAFTNTPATDFEALSFGPMVGFQRISADACALISEVCSAAGLTAGGTVDYGWRLGREKQFAALAGAGVKTGFGFGDLGTARLTYPFVRLAVGYVLPSGR